MKAASIVALTVVLVLIGTRAYAADCAGGGRFEVIGDGTVQDCRTGLIWLQNARCTETLNGIPNPTGRLAWYDAMTWVRGLRHGHCGLTEGSFEGYWRLPTINEWMALVAYSKMYFNGPALTNSAGNAKWTTDGDAFSNVPKTGASYFWSSPRRITSIGQFGYMMDIYDGTPLSNTLISTEYVWPVRAGQVSGNDAGFDTVTIE